MQCEAQSTNLRARFQEPSRLPRDPAPATSISRKLSPNSLSFSQQSPPGITHQNTTLHPLRVPSSDASLSQDCAFPPFPTSKSRTTTATPPPQIVQSFAVHHQSVAGDSHASFAPLSPQGNAGSVLRKMDAIASGAIGDFRPNGHIRTTTMSSSKDFTYQPNGGSRKSHSSRPSTAGSNTSRKPSLASISRGPRSHLVHTNMDLPTLSTRPTNPVRSYTTGDIEEDQSGGLAERKESIEKLRPESRSRTYPMNHPNKQENGTRRPSAPSLHVTRPSVAAAIRPLHEIGSVSTFKPTRSLKGRRQSQVGIIINESGLTSAENATGGSQNNRNAHASRASNLASEYRTEVLHAPGESTSSSGSSDSGAGSASSASTPSFSGSPQQQQSRSSSLRHKIFMPDFRFDRRTPSDMEEPASPRNNSSLGVPLRLARTGPANVLAPEPNGSAARPTLDPAIHSGRSLSPKPSNDVFARLPMPSNSRVTPPGNFPSSSARPSDVHKSASVNKGLCRGCNEVIVGKSVSSADGRLTGRYHKRCFMCMTCKEPFRTADFYVHDNHPYCQRHYHQLNKSLCAACDCGIEGRYVEIDDKQKFHQDCFTCQVSRNMTRCFLSSLEQCYRHRSARLMFCSRIANLFFEIITLRSTTRCTASDMFFERHDPTRHHNEGEPVLALSGIQNDDKHDY